MKKFTPSTLRDTFVFGGALLAAVGFSVAWLPLGLIVLGVFLAALGLFWGTERKQRN